MLCPKCGGNTRVTSCVEGFDRVDRVRKCIRCEYVYSTIEREVKKEAKTYERPWRGKKEEKE